jgi:hypothetical protein
MIISSTAERQRRYRERLYKVGLKQAYVWIKRKEGRNPLKMSITEFVRQLKKETAGMREESLMRLLTLMIKIVKGKKEEAKLREKK